MQETIALRLLRAARKLGFAYVTEDELITHLRANDPPPPPQEIPVFDPKMWDALMARLIASMNADRAGIPQSPPYPGHIPPQIPPPAQRQVPWRVILGIPLDKPITPQDVHSRWKLLATVYHPDAGGSKEAFNAITEARDYGLRELGTK